VGAAAGVGEDQDPVPEPARQLRQGEPGGLDVISGRVRARVPWPQHDSQRFPVPVRPVIGPGGHRVMPFSELDSITGFPGGWSFSGRVADGGEQQAGVAFIEAGDGVVEINGDTAAEAGAGSAARRPSRGARLRPGR
jgi:hypothetical protein